MPSLTLTQPPNRARRWFLLNRSVSMSIMNKHGLLERHSLLLTIGILVLATRESVRRRLGAPAALGLPYAREERSR